MVDGSERNEVAVAESNDVDRLSELPDSLIFTIFSLLESRDVVSTTFLSKRWKNRWATVPCLAFRNNLPRFIYGALTQWRGPNFLKLTIAFTNFLPRANDLNSWLLFAIAKQVEELSIHLGLLRIGASATPYSPPQRFYSCSSFRKLSLSHLRLQIEGNNVQWGQLKSLTIVGSNSLSAYAINRILCGAPRLEELNLCIREIGGRFTIQSTSLKTLCIGRQDDCFEIVEVYLGSILVIDAPNLSSLVILSRCYGRCLLNVPSLSNAVLSFFWCGDDMDPSDLSRIQMFNRVFQSVRHVESLTLSNWCIKFLLFMKMNDVLVEFPNVKSLHLFPDEPADEMLDVLEMCPMLMFFTAQLQCAQKGDSFASTRNATLVSLKRVEIRWSVNDASVFRVIETILENAYMLEKMVLRVRGTGVDGGEPLILAHEKVLRMPRSSPTVEVIIIQD
ncbi:putative F-box/FBD/LRR-repeat protein At5g22670 [Salvia miltiorrhiza]|uniref:putative F-box/FBD/LRR-repeat protein At5g22670 n=1 Tax=Salvia miltiorrhiza TaxID=226208 RepID=UPI0025ACBF22|nr:putative F-box/FBD/LRR-repeat protein At5g22670 [Salvia miltiorrhiza]